MAAASTSTNPSPEISSSTDSHSAASGWKPRPNFPPGASSPDKPIIDPVYLPGGKKSLSGISIRSFLLGQAAGTCAVLSALLYTGSNPLWRVPFFVATLALFHFLEYYVTARYNNYFAKISAFLLTQNGMAYNIAHGSAVVECLLAHTFLPDRYFQLTGAVFGGIKYQVMLGLALMVVGQIVRSLAMVQAGVSFTHTIQHHRREEHRLVKDGIYSILRHPSYFGFFWWGLGTQLVLGNTVCFLGYAVVLWEFFSSRIRTISYLIYLPASSSQRTGSPSMCHVRTHIHNICKCETHHIRICNTFQIPPCPSYPAGSSRFLQVRNSQFIPGILSHCPNLDTYPDVVDPYPCSKHWNMLGEQPCLVLGPPRTESRYEYIDGGSETLEAREISGKSHGKLDKGSKHFLNNRGERCGSQGQTPSELREQRNQSPGSRRSNDEKKCWRIWNLWGLLDS
ncbi:hypothetical protein UREG_00813 [Uncinocarpus reesii 1704]|uniref:Protein-S-isoprenylcysteine O-methyltransferase n=1 Tax=Uncinocarpus reesii (strain UAMH 1704) TaxID=336963 RepID=C4JEH4_UNCRE|nr:uncharacterized protein UREG_00813 [Uncinocarpus reesii 1704]EEP75966.1 hypothetical protein UREG_00813 [Uncinocarpus reesii 1704]